MPASSRCRAAAMRGNETNIPSCPVKTPERPRPRSGGKAGVNDAIAVGRANMNARLGWGERKGVGGPAGAYRV